MNRFPVILLMATLAFQTRASIVDFEDLGIPLGAQFDPVGGFNSGGFNFIQGPGTQINDLHVGSPAFWGVANGTTIMLTHGDAITSMVGSGLFSLNSVDLSGFQGIEGPVTIVGKYLDLSTVTYVANLDGVIDGVGGAQDFETFLMPASFTGLMSVDFLGNSGDSGLFAIDNLKVNETSTVPDQGTTLSLLGVACLLLGAFGQRVRHRLVPSARL